MKKTLALLIALSLLLGLFAACGSSSTSTDSTSEETLTTTVEENTADDDTATIDSSEEEKTETESESVPDYETSSSDDTGSLISFPLDDTLEISIYYVITSTYSEFVEDIDDMMIFQELEDRLNIKWDMQIFRSSSDSDNAGYSLMIAAGDYCDIITSVAELYSGGEDTAIEENVIIDLLDYAEYAPNYFDTISDESLYNAVLTSEGHIARFTYMYDESIPTRSGPVIRADWLEEAGMDIPVTYDDYAEFLEWCVINKDVSSALMLNGSGVHNNDYLARGFGVSMASNFYLDGDTVCFSYDSDGAYEYISLLNEWYNAGYISSDFVNYNVMNTPLDEILNGQIGIMYTNNANFETWKESASDESFELAAIYDATTDDGVGAEYVNMQPTQVVSAAGWSISTQCENPELVAAVIDYFYTDEGYILANYGVEGVSYEIDENGEMKLVDDILLNDKNTVVNYCMASGPFADHTDRMNYYYSEQQLEVNEFWSKTYASNLESLPTLTYTLEEQEVINQYQNDLETYISEYLVSFITGAKSLEDYDTFISNMETFHIDELLEVKQSAYNRTIGVG